MGVSPPPPCPCDQLSPRDGLHLTVCPATSRLRPPDIVTWIHLDARRDSVMRWAAHHHYFGITLRTSQVRWISLSRPGNLVPSSRPTCDICSRTFSNASHLTRHRNHLHPDSSSNLFVIGALANAEQSKQNGNPPGCPPPRSSEIYEQKNQDKECPMNDELRGSGCGIFFHI